MSAHHHHLRRSKHGVQGGDSDFKNGITSADCVLWLDAALGAETTSGNPATDGQGLEHWRDQSGEGNDFYQSGGASFEPTWNEDGGADWLNQPTIGFDSSDAFIGPDFSSLTDGEMFVLCANTADPPGVSSSAGAVATFGSTAVNAHHPWTDGNIYDTFGYGGSNAAERLVANPSDSLTAPFIMNAWAVGLSGERDIEINGTSIDSTTTGTIGFRTETYIGAKFTSSFRKF